MDARAAAQRLYSLVTLSLPLVIALIGTLGALAGTILGWALGQLSGVLARRVENRSRYNAVLADLLEIRHQLLTAPKLADAPGMVTRLLEPGQIAALGPMPPDAPAIFDRLFAHILPGTAALEESYTHAVTEVARLDPALGHVLRDQETPLRLGLAFAKLAKAAGVPREKVSAMQDAIAHEIVPELEGLLVDVAGQARGRRGRREMRDLLRRTPRSEAEVQTRTQRLAASLIPLFTPDPPAGAS